MGAAAVMGGAMENLLGGNGSNTIQAQAQAQDSARRSSTPGASTGGGFSSIFNLKSVISAATKTTPAPQPTPSASNFYVSSPPVVPVEPITVELRSQSIATVPQKTVQGIVFSLDAFEKSVCVSGFLFAFSLFSDEILF